AISDDELRFIMDVNLTEALLCTRAVGPHMLARRSGKVINIAAWTAHQGGRDNVLYTTAKTALAGFTRAQALEWAPYGLHVNAIGPGLFPDVVTSGEEGVARSTKRAKEQVPLGRPGRLREVGLLRLHPAPAASDYMTGQPILLDGGLGWGSAAARRRFAVSSPASFRRPSRCGHADPGPSGTDGAHLVSSQIGRREANP